MRLWIECAEGPVSIDCNGSCLDVSEKYWYNSEEAMWEGFDAHLQRWDHKRILRVYREDGSQFSGPPPEHVRVIQTPEGYEPE